MADDWSETRKALEVGTVETSNTCPQKFRHIERGNRFPFPEELRSDDPH
jgi:hypothetical protein